MLELSTLFVVITIINCIVIYDRILQTRSEVFSPVTFTCVCALCAKNKYI